MEEKKKINIDTLFIEVTRRCNQVCSFCIRGHAQPIDLDFSSFLSLMQQDNYKIVSIRQLLLTGGEIFLVPDLVIQILNYFLDNNIKVERLNILTGGLIYNQKIMDILKKFSLISDVKLITSLDQFHKPMDRETYIKFRSYKFYYFNEVFLEQPAITNFGLAEENGLGDKERTDEYLKVFTDNAKSSFVFDSNNTIQGIYLTARGKIGFTPYCDASYDMLDDFCTIDIQNNNLLDYEQVGYVYKKRRNNHE